MLVPLFPRLGPELAPRVEQALIKVKDKTLAEEEFLDFMTIMMGCVFADVVESPRLKNSFGRTLPSLTGKNLLFHVGLLRPWVIEVAPTPQVLSFRSAIPEEARDAPGFAGEFNTMKTIIVGHEEPIASYHSLVEGRVKVINASPTSPATWIRSLFGLIGPALDRKDLVDRAMLKAGPVLDSKLRGFGC